jgi:hypothetical protein
MEFLENMLNKIDPGFDSEFLLFDFHIIIFFNFLLLLVEVLELLL